MLHHIYRDIFGGWYGAAVTEMFDLFAYWFDGYMVGETGIMRSHVHQDAHYIQSFIAYILINDGLSPAPYFKADTFFYAHQPYTGDVTFPGCRPLRNLGDMITDSKGGFSYLRTLPQRECYSTFAHGDANLQENFLIDDRGNIWVIDFYLSSPRNRVLRDLVKTYACIMYYGVCISTDAMFSRAGVCHQRHVE